MQMLASTSEHLSGLDFLPNNKLERNMLVHISNNFFSFSPDIALPSVSAYDNEDSMLNFVKTQLQEIAKQKGNYDDMLLLM